MPEMPQIPLVYGGAKSRRGVCIVLHSTLTALHIGDEGMELWGYAALCGAVKHHPVFLMLF
jgi:hypothetical protein